MAISLPFFCSYLKKFPSWIRFRKMNADPCESGSTALVGISLISYDFVCKSLDFIFIENDGGSRSVYSNLLLTYTTPPPQLCTENFPKSYVLYYLEHYLDSLHVIFLADQNSNSF